MDTEEYIKKASRQLSDKNNYKTFLTNPILQHNKMVNGTLYQFENENLLPQKTAEGLKATNPKTPKFNISPKIHKDNYPERPVINSINCHISEIARFVDHHPKPFVKEIPSYIKDTNNFVNKINKYKKHSNDLVKEIVEKGYKENIIRDQIEKVDNL